MTHHTLTLRGPADIAAALPSLLGFHPKHSIVIVAFDDSRIVLTMRIDAPHAPDRAWADEVIARTRHVRADSVIFIAADEAFHPEPTYGDAAMTSLMASESEREVLDALMVGGGRWRSYLCDGACCPVEGTPIPAGDVDRIRCSMSVSGQVLATDRDAIRAEFEAGELIALGRFPVLDVNDAWVSSTRERLTTVLATLCGEMAVEFDDDTMLFVAALQSPRVRDAMLWMVTSHTESENKLLLRNLAQIIRSCPDEVVDGVAVLAGLTAWLVGDGARGTDACERALTANPNNVLAELLINAMAAGLPPSMWRDGIANISQEACWAGRLRTAA